MSESFDGSSSGLTGWVRRNGRALVVLAGALVVVVGTITAFALVGRGSNSSATPTTQHGTPSSRVGASESTTDPRAPGSRSSPSTGGTGSASTAVSAPSGSSVTDGTGPASSTLAPKSTPTTFSRKFGLGGHYVGGTAPPPVQTDPTIEQAYVSAYRAECQKIWSIATSDGRLWDPDADPPRTPYTVSDCLSQLSPGASAYAFDIVDAAQSGTSDADDAASGLTWFGKLQNTPGTKTWIAPE